MKKESCQKPAYRRVLIKMSGEVMGGEQGYGICPEAVHGLADQIVAVHKLGVDVAVVIGGGNIFEVSRGARRALNAPQATTWACWPP